MLTRQDLKFLDKARDLAITSIERNKHGAIVVRSGKIVGRGINKTRNNNHMVSPEHIKTDCSYHAEVVALRRAGQSAKNGVLYVARVNNNGEDKNSQPCPRCQDAIAGAGIKRVVFTITGEYCDH